jgi:hypothetical protein
MASTVIRLNSSKRWVWGLVLLVLVALALAWWVQGRAGGESPVQVSASDGRSAWPTVPTAADETDKLMFSKEPVGEARPADFSQSTWDTLNAALANAPNKDQERTRVVSYLRFQRAVSKWGEMTSGAATPERVELAHQIMDEMPVHVASGEVNPAEAMAAIAALAIDMEADQSKRAAWIESQRVRLKATETPAQAQALQAEKDKVKRFEEEKAAITSRWMSSPEASRDPATLESQLQALRERVFGVAN